MGYLVVVTVGIAGPRLNSRVSMNDAKRKLWRVKATAPYTGKG